MNLTSLAPASGTTKYDKNATPQDVGAEPRQLTMGPVPVPKSKPTISLLRDAMDAFNVKGTARALAFELLSYWAPGGTVFPSVATLAAGLGLKPRMVQYHMKRLERIGLWLRHGRTGTTNIYKLRLPGGVQPIARGGVQPIAPRSNQREVVPPKPPSRGARRKRTGPKPRGGMPTYTERPVRASPPMTAQQTADAEDLAVANGWRKVGGSWRRR